MVETPTGKKIRQARQYRNMTLEALAAVSGVGVGRISEIENGKVEHPRTSTLTALAKALKVPPGVLVDDDIPNLQVNLKSTGLQLPDHLLAWLSGDDAFQWVHIAYEASLAGLTPCELEQAIELVKRHTK